MPTTQYFLEAVLYNTCTIKREGYSGKLKIYEVISQENLLFVLSVHIYFGIA